MKIRCSAICLLLFSCMLLLGGEAYRLELPHLKRVPVLDGVISGGEWEDAASFTGMQLTTDRGLATEQSRFYMKWDKDYIYIAAICADSNISNVTDEKGAKWNDCLEFFISAPGERHVAHWLLYATGGSKLDFIDAEYGSGFRGNSDGVVSVPRLNQQDWTIEARIPAASLYRDYFDSRLPFRFNIHRSFAQRATTRKDGRPPEYSSFAKVRGQLLKPADFAELFLNDESVAPVRLEKLDISGMRLACRDDVDVMLDFDNGRRITLRSNNGVFAADFPALCQSVQVRVLREGFTIFSNRYDFRQQDEAEVKRLSDRQRAVSGLGVDVVDSMTRIFPQNPYCRQESRIEVSAARNEAENFQLVLFTGRDSVNQVQVEVSDFRSAGGGVLPASTAQLFHEGTMIADPAGYPTVNGAGEYPDPLYELKPLNLAPMQTEAVWVSLKVPADAAPGVYDGTITVRAAALPPQEVSVRLTVWDFELPVRQSLRTAFSLWERELYRLYFKGTDRPISEFLQLVDDYATMLVEHRLSPLIFKTAHVHTKEVMDAVATRFRMQPDGSCKVIPGKFDEMTRRYLEKGATTFIAGPEIPHSEYKNLKEAEWKAMWTAIRDHYAANGMLKYAFAYPFSEPGNHRRALINPALSWLKEAVPELPVMITGASALLPSKEFSHIDVWCPQLHWVNSRTKAEAQAKGQQVWWYPCSGPWYPYPNYHLDIEPGAWRSLAWATYKYDFDGILYWAAAFYNVKDTRRNNSYGANGEGVLLYNHPESGAPCPSIRLKVIADSMEDYEYLKLLEAAVKANEGRADKAEAVAKGRELLSLKDIFRAMDDYALSCREYDNFRKAAAELILELKITNTQQDSKQ